MKHRPNRILPPPGPGAYVRGEVLEAISEEEKNGRPVAPYVEVTPAIPPEVLEAEERDRKAGGR
jgi:hypothetical protein